MINRAPSLIDTASIEENLRPLANVLNEMKKRVDVVFNHFTNVVNVAQSAKGMKYSPWSYRPLSNGIRQATQWYLSEAQYQQLFVDCNIHLDASGLLRDVFNYAFQELMIQPTEVEFANVLEKLNVGLIGIGQLYLNAMTSASKLAETFHQLPQGLQDATDKYLREQKVPTIGGDLGIAIGGAQHIARIPLMLQELSKVAQRSTNERIQFEGKKLQGIIEDMVKPTLRRKFTSSNL